MSQLVNEFLGGPAWRGEQSRKRAVHMPILPTCISPGDPAQPTSKAKSPPIIGCYWRTGNIIRKIFQECYSYL